MSKWLLKGGRVVDPAADVDDVLDVLVDGSKIGAIKRGIKVSGAEVVDARGKIVSPGFVDMHVHLREPGREDEETIETGARAAIRGGFTSICCMPNTNPVVDDASVVEQIKDLAKQSPVRVHPVAAITQGLGGKELTEMGELVRQGAVAFSDDGRCLQSARVMRRALDYVKMFDTPLIIHAEDESLSKKGQMNEGYYSTLLGLKGIPTQAEEVIVARDIKLAELTGGKIHIAHVSTQGSVELIGEAKKKGISVTCEVTPHHLVLTDEALVDYDTNLKVNPPLRSDQDQKALIEGLRDGIIDAIASDHAPHAAHEKEQEFDYAPFGMIGLETTLALVLTRLVNEKAISLKQAMGKLTAGPAEILGLEAGTVSVGSRADITIFDTKKDVTVDAGKFESKSKNSPFVGWKLKGSIEHVFVGGKLVLKEGKLVR